MLHRDQRRQGGAGGEPATRAAGSGPGGRRARPAQLAARAAGAARRPGPRAGRGRRRAGGRCRAPRRGPSGASRASSRRWRWSGACSWRRQRRGPAARPAGAGPARARRRPARPKNPRLRSNGASQTSLPKPQTVSTRAGHRAAARRPWPLDHGRGPGAHAGVGMQRVHLVQAPGLHGRDARGRCDRSPRRRSRAGGRPRARGRAGARARGARPGAGQGVLDVGELGQCVGHRAIRAS